MYVPGGYQTIDISSVTLAEQAVTVTDAKFAEILRTTRKPVFLHGAKQGAMTVSGICTLVTDTVAKDGRVYYWDDYSISTNDNTVTFTPLA